MKIEEMATKKKRSIGGRAIGVSVFAIIWFCLSLCITILFAEDEDPVVPSAPVPRLVSVLYGIARFPVCNILSWDALRLDFGETKAMDVELLGIFANGIFWGIIFCSFIPKFLKLIRMKPGTNAQADRK